MTILILLCICTWFLSLKDMGIESTYEPVRVYPCRTKYKQTLTYTYIYEHMDIPSARTSYASEISLNFFVASSWSVGFLSGCHFRASRRYLQQQRQIKTLHTGLSWTFQISIAKFDSWVITSGYYLFLCGHNIRLKLDLNASNYYEIESPFPFTSHTQHSRLKHKHETWD
jgi:hypothetical protein